MKNYRFILVYLIMVVVQVLLDNFFPLSRYVLISVLPALILVLPVDTRPIAAMLLSFALGLVVDFFSNGMLGMSSLALVPVVVTQIVGIVIRYQAHGLTTPLWHSGPRPCGSGFRFL